MQKSKFWEILNSTQMGSRHSVAPIFGQNHANARCYIDISPKNRCHKPSKRAMPKWTEIFLCWGFPLTNSYLSPGLSSPQLLVDDLIDRTGQGKNGVIRTSIFPKLCSTLVDWPLQQQFFPHLTQHIQSWSLIRVTIAMGEHRAGAWGVNKDQNRYVVQFGDTSLILSGEPRECSSQVSIGAGKLPRM